MGALSFVHGRIGPLGRFSYSGAVLKDFRCAEMSSAMPTGAATASNSPISSTLAWRRPNFCGAADASRRTDYSAHTWQHAHPNDVAASAGRDAPARNCPDDAGLYTARLLHTNARERNARRRAPYARRRAPLRKRPTTRPPPAQTRRRATPRAGATGRPCRPTSRKIPGPTSPRACL